MNLLTDEEMDRAHAAAFAAGRVAVSNFGARTRALLAAQALKPDAPQQVEDAQSVAQMRALFPQGGW